MTAWFLLACLVVVAAANWFVCAAGMRRNASSVVFSVFVSVVTMVAAILSAIIQKQTSLDPALLAIGIGNGAAGALAWILTLYCLKIGPTGLTVMVSNLGLVWPVLIGLIWFSERLDRLPLTVSGIVLAIAALVLLSTSRTEDDRTPITSQWLRFAMISWIAIGAIGICMLIAARHDGGSRSAYVALVYGTQTLILTTVAFIRRSMWLERKALALSVFAGLLTAFESIVFLVILASLPAEIVFPTTVIMPLIMILLVGNFFMGEKMAPKAWGACLIGIVAVAVLSM